MTTSPALSSSSVAATTRPSTLPLSSNTRNARNVLTRSFSGSARSAKAERATIAPSRSAKAFALHRHDEVLLFCLHLFEERRHLFAVRHRGVHPGRAVER